MLRRQDGLVMQTEPRRERGMSGFMLLEGLVALFLLGLTLLLSSSLMIASAQSLARSQARGEVRRAMVSRISAASDSVRQGQVGCGRAEFVAPFPVETLVREIRGEAAGRLITMTHAPREHRVQQPAESLYLFDPTLPSCAE